MVGLDGIEPSTSRLSGVRSNRTELQALIKNHAIRTVQLPALSILEDRQPSSDAIWYIAISKDQILIPEN